MTSSSRHVRSLWASQPSYATERGSIRALNADNFPILNGLSIKRLVLAPGSLREPHWHVNTNELTYCISGRLLVSVLDSGSQFARFEVSAGQMFHIASGALHTLENIGDSDAVLIAAFRHERPAEFSLRESFAVMSDAVLGNTFDLPAADMAALRQGQGKGAALSRREGPPTIPDTAGFGDAHRFDVEAQSAPVSSAAGSARLARDTFWPVLKNISMYSLRVETSGMREPHWHPLTSEMGYIEKGNARMTILDPNGSVDTYQLQPGDVYFIPRAYPHHIEVTGSEEIHFLIFFDQPTPGDVGYRAAASSLSPSALAATFGVPVASLPRLPFTPADPLIVARSNPLDS
ncbi:cupin domain-containing protein [Comamonas sp. JUb58]|uniref:cupin domain-containing protein n=1 Tax=Comamonas sp. JUb58 TaxID=2485114 RepID=UPI00105ED40C|nr:cupin domain-containing protein [Comamonas sp. JUb58]TDS83709.1 oxalate decarboxylase [Comamonas sp. JUb58]